MYYTLVKGLGLEMRVKGETGYTEGNGWLLRPVTQVA